MDSVVKEQLIVAGYNTVGILGCVIALGMLLNIIKMQMLKLCCSAFGKTVGEFLVNRFTFIGVVHHELSHALMALVFGA